MAGQIDSSTCVAFQLAEICTKGLSWPDVVSFYLVDHVASFFHEVSVTLSQIFLFD